MSAVLADTHAVLWHLFDPAQLSAAAAAAIQAALAAGDFVSASSITLVETRYLVEKHRLPTHYLTDLLAAVGGPRPTIEVFPLMIAVARATEHIPRSIVRDLPDRIIAATALVHGLPLVTADRQIRAAPIPTIW